MRSVGSPKGVLLFPLFPETIEARPFLPDLFVIENTPNSSSHKHAAGDVP
jgi:hypothetical protein